MLEHRDGDTRARFSLPGSRPRPFYPLVRSLSAAVRQRSGLRHTSHRPWPLPGRRWLIGQTWERLLFMHWPLEPQALRPAVPAELPIDTFEGRAWIAITPFDVLALRLRGRPHAPNGA